MEWCGVVVMLPGGDAVEWISCLWSAYRVALEAASSTVSGSGEWLVVVVVMIAVREDGCGNASCWRWLGRQ